MDNQIDHKNYILGAGAGYLSYKVAKKIGTQIKKPYSDQVFRQIRNFSKEENALLNKAAYDIFAVSGLGSKPNRFYLHHVDSNNFKRIATLLDRKYENIKYIKILKKLRGNVRPLNTKEKNELAKSLNNHIKNKEYKKAWQEFKNACKGKPIIKSDNKGKIITSNSVKKLVSSMKMVSEGQNAIFFPLTRDIVVNMDKLSGALFHEMGHALNVSGPKIIQALALSRYLTKLFIPLIFAIGLLKPKKKDGQKPNGIIDKTTTFIKNNVGKLTFAAFVPILAEEGLASIRGAKMAKKVLPPKLLKKVNFGNFLGWTTYFISAHIMTGAVFSGVKIRDKIAEK